MDADDHATIRSSDDAPLTPDEIAPLVDNLAGPDAPLRAASLAALVTLPLSTKVLAGRLRPTGTVPAARSHSRAKIARSGGPGADPARAWSAPRLDRHDRRHGSRPGPHVRLGPQPDTVVIPRLLDDFLGESESLRTLAAEHLSFFDVPEARDAFAQVVRNDPDPGHTILGGGVPGPDGCTWGTEESPNSEWPGITRYRSLAQLPVGRSDGGACPAPGARPLAGSHPGDARAGHRVGQPVPET